MTFGILMQRYRGFLSYQKEEVGLTMVNTQQSAAIERVPSGISGFDQITQGGLLKGETYLLMGPPGAGKTIFGNQLCFNHVVNGGCAIYLTLLAETHSRMLSHMQAFSFYREEPLADRLHLLSGYTVLEQQGLDALLTLIRKEVRKQHASLLMIDGAVTIGQNATSIRERKEFLHALSVITETVGCTTMLLLQSDGDAYDQPEHTMVDGLFQISTYLNDMRAVREFQVRKFRGSNFLMGRHLYEINEDGFNIHPRTESLFQASQQSLPPSLTTLNPAERLSFGIPSLDKMMRGGVPAATSTVVMGAPGTGKTLLGLHFLYQGALQNEAGLYFGFSETPAQLKRRMTHLGLKIEDVVTNNLLNIDWQPPTEDIIDVLAERLFEQIDKHGIRRLFIDGLAGFQGTTVSATRLQLFLASLFEALRKLDVTTVWGIELADLFSPTIVMTDLIANIANIGDNIIFLRHVELHSQLYRLLSIMKMRQSGYDPSIREFRITDSGLDVAPTFDSAEAILTGMARQPEPAGASSGRPYISNMARPETFRSEVLHAQEEHE
ncbi:ATPase domain-containing protein [Dictyobacter arantiisoli]|uniref:non-specific serine/threonine protein kinase n=1 Tax=Dictyobacter arantiisoli TaxID=2014874 RepID=A0A5A5THV7_9CHLR|nr:ATPase domain-containing protein [Dictyobacter arantiisoli]GCF10643.1 circadian clock protein kinase KaiC [Dictyobacter arantiisoli]